MAYREKRKSTLKTSWKDRVDATKTKCAECGTTNSSIWKPRQSAPDLVDKNLAKEAEDDDNKEVLCQKCFLAAKEKQASTESAESASKETSDDKPTTDSTEGNKDYAFLTDKKSPRLFCIANSEFRQIVVYFSLDFR